jgi:pyruvate,water dikinase
MRCAIGGFARSREGDREYPACAPQPAKFLRRGYAPDEGEIAAPVGGRLTGLAASPGQARGRARVVYDISELSRVEAGDILVTRQTDPSWTPAFARLSGLVLETGGVLAHGASLCREFGLPCVTALERATEQVQDGQAIALDGAAGTVDLL